MQAIQIRTKTCKNNHQENWSVTINTEAIKALLIRGKKNSRTKLVEKRILAFKIPTPSLKVHYVCTQSKTTDYNTEYGTCGSPHHNRS